MQESFFYVNLFKNNQNINWTPHLLITILLKSVVASLLYCNLLQKLLYRIMLQAFKNIFFIVQIYKHKGSTLPLQRCFSNLRAGGFQTVVCHLVQSVRDSQTGVLGWQPASPSAGTVFYSWGLAKDNSETSGGRGRVHLSPSSRTVEAAPTLQLSTLWDMDKMALSYWEAQELEDLASREYCVQCPQDQGRVEQTNEEWLSLRSRLHHVFFSFAL